MSGFMAALPFRRLLVTDDPSDPTAKRPRRQAHDRTGLSGLEPGRRRSSPLPQGERETRVSGSVPTRRGPADSFTGTVWQDPIIDAPAPARIRATRVSFEPRARTAWHTHPLGQTLHVLSGVGRVQAWGGPVREIRPGDTVWIPPGEKHWHGAGPSTGMVHIA